jgi:hypothetical protein
MNFKKTVARTAIVGALGFSALGLGVGLGTASADPGNGGQPCLPQNCQRDPHGGGGDGRQFGDQGRPDQGRPDQGGWDQRPWDQRGIDDARRDHQPFNWQGQRVEPYFDNDRGAWGFWFLGVWIPL